MPQHGPPEQPGEPKPKKAYQKPAPREPNPEDAKLLSALVLEANALEKQATTDPLTGLYNRRHLEHKLDLWKQETDRKRLKLQGHADTHGHPSRAQDVDVTPNFAFVFLDIDHFKKFNDQFGHPTGDAVLRQVAAAIRSSVRDEEGDVVARFGGEELAVLLRGVDEEQAITIGERIRRNIEQEVKTWVEEAINYEQKLDRPVTVSVGVATYEPQLNDDGKLLPPESQLSCKELILRADKCLYYAKENGRNAVSSFHIPTLKGMTEKSKQKSTIRLLRPTAADGELTIEHEQAA